MTTHKPFQLGSISTGTLRTEDLLPKFALAIISFVGRSEYGQINSTTLNQAIEVNSGEKPSYPLDALESFQDALQELCPPFVYFGAHPGDGADFGFWPDWDALDELVHTHSDFGAGHSWTVRDQNCRMHFDGDREAATCLDLEDNVLWAS